ncbi:MAG: hypothetical protein L3J37_05490 [Rhodobacteraceae bacterium]|nr:hypothetical protein [Paracoccaceae bacterium]
MKYIIAVVIILAGGYFYPQIAESTGGPCQALEAKVVNEIRTEDSNVGLLAGLVSGVSNGELGKQLAAQNYPDTPTSLACVRGYYSLDPKDIG